MVAWKKLKLPKVGKKCLKLSFFLWFTHWWNCFCETDWLRVCKDIKEILKFYENELRLHFNCYILIPRKCPCKPLFQHTVGGGGIVNSPAPRSYGPSVIKDLAAAASNDWLTAGAQPPSQYLAKKHFWTIKKGRQHRSKYEILFDTPS